MTDTAIFSDGKGNPVKKAADAALVEIHTEDGMNVIMIPKKNLRKGDEATGFGPPERHVAP
jgi:hypothetical protein